MPERIAEHYRGLPVLVPGGAGFLGSRLCRRLAALGAEVTAVDSLDPRCGGERSRLAGVAELVEAPIEELAVGGGPRSGQIGRFDRWALIFNCIGLADHHLGFERPEVDYRINCASGLALLAALHRDGAGGRLISFGSRNQYGRPGDGAPLTEEAPLAPLDVQAVHKTALEGYQAVYGARWGLATAFVRLTNLYGPGMRLAPPGTGFVGELLGAALAGRELVVYGGLDRVKDLVYVDDAVEAVVALGAVEGEEGRGVFNLGGAPCRIGELLAAIEAAIEGAMGEERRPLAVRVEPFPAAIARLDTGDTVLDCGRLERATGWRPTTGLADGVAATLAVAVAPPTASTVGEQAVAR